MSVIERGQETLVTPTSVTAVDVLNRAADLLEEFGWCQGELGSKEHGRMCAVGAIRVAALERGVFLNDWAEGVSAGFCPTDVHGSWNDERGRTKAEVVAKLREAARAAA